MSLFKRIKDKDDKIKDIDIPINMNTAIAVEILREDKY
jgi:hypothetical protein